MQHGYGLPVNTNTLMAPSTKDFEQMVTFLLRCVDPMFHSPNAVSMKFEDEVVLHFRALGYPFSLSKTSIVAAGSPHAWPGNMAALGWLVDHLSLIEPHVPPENPILFSETVNCDVSYNSQEELAVVSERLFFDCLLESYGAFLQGDGEQVQILTQALSERFMRDNVYFEEEENRLHDLNGAMVTEMNVSLESVSQ